MALTKLGPFIELCDQRNAGNLMAIDSVVGLSTAKTIIKTKADLDGVSLASYKILPPNHFAFVPDTSRRGEKMSLGYNTEDRSFLVSSISVVFRVSEGKELLSDYLFMFINRPEFDRYTRFNSWGSAREVFSWDEFCDIEIDLPPPPVQQKYVEVYNSMLANQRAYESGLEDLKLTCDAYIEKLRRELPHTPIRAYIKQCDKRNSEGLSVESVRGLAVSKAMIETKADMNGVSLGNYKVVPPMHIAYVPDTSRRGEKISLGFNGTDEACLVSSISLVFGTDHDHLLPEYLMLFFARSEFDRYTRFHSWGSAREVFGWEDMCDVAVPIPDVKVQESIVNIYKVYKKRSEINERMKAQIKALCPVLIKGSIEEACRVGAIA